MDTIALIERLSVALSIGLLIGIERGWHDREAPEGSRALGIRTLGLSGLLGGILAAITPSLGSGGALFLGLGFSAFTIVIAVYRYRETSVEGTFGATTLVAAMLAYALGALAVLGDLQIAAAAGIVATALLASKRLLHEGLRRITWPELRSGLLLLAMTFVLLPLLPDRTIDPWQALNPHKIWLMTIAIAALSYSGYAAVRIAGEHRGIFFTGLAGGLVSSTAATVTLSRLVKEHPERRDLLMAGVVVASATMLLRVLVVVSIFNIALLRFLGAPLAVAAVAFAVIGYLLFRRASMRSDAGESMALKNPFDLTVVLQFGALLAVVLLLSRFASRNLGDLGVFALAIVSGTADVDAISLSMSRLAGTEVALPTAAAAIALAVVSNTISKSVLAAWAGGVAAGLRLGLASAAAILAGAAAAALSHTFL